MLVAYGPHGRTIIAEETPLEELQHLSRERLLYCPNCRGALHLRGGPEKRIQLHFAHQKGECAWSTEAESVRHARGKIVLAQWLQRQFPQSIITLEERLPEPNRIADIFMVSAHGQRWAIEFQCAPLNLEEWQLRHTAYRAVNILDIWIIGHNRHDKQEAFIEAIVAEAHEVMFLEPLLTPPRICLRWAVTRENVRAWEREAQSAPLLEGWVGRLGYGVSLTGQLYDVRLGEQGRLIHPARSALEERAKLLSAMEQAQSVDEMRLAEYLRPIVSEEALRVVVLPLVRAYLRDTELLWGYNYGRGRTDQPLSERDEQRISQARVWMRKLAEQGFHPEKLQALVKNVPFVGPYAAFVRYVEMLVALF